MSSEYIAPKYKPTPEVTSTHSIIHVDAMGGFTTVDNTFDPLNMDYLYSVVTVPAIILGVGIIAILLLFIISNCFTPSTCFWKYCWYYICCCFCCPPKDKDVDIKKLEEKKQEWLTRSSKAVKACYGVIIAIVVGALFLWMGNADLTKGMNDAITGVTMLKDLVLGLIDTVAGPTDSLVTNTDALLDSISGDGCSWMATAMCDTNNAAIQTCDTTCADACTSITSTLNAVSGYGDVIVNQGSSINSLADPIEAGLDSMNTGIADAIPMKDMYVLYVFIGLIVLCFLNFLTVWRKSPYISCVVSILNYVLMIVLLIICSISMILVMVLSDFCVDPAAGLMTVAGGASETIQYYTTCVGTNKFQSSLDSIDQQLTNFANYIGDSTNTGQSTSIYNLEDTFVSLDNTYNLQICSVSNSNCHQCSEALNPKYAAIQVNVNDITADLSCESINKMYDQLINTAFCKSSFSGIYKVWGDLYFIALFLFVLLCCISKLYQYMISDDDVEARKPWFKPHYKLVVAEVVAEVEMTQQSDNRPSVVNIL